MVRRRINVGAVATVFSMTLAGCAEVPKASFYPEPECVLLCALIRSLAGDAEPTRATVPPITEPQKPITRVRHKPLHRHVGQRLPRVAVPTASPLIPETTAAVPAEPSRRQKDGWIQLPGSSPIEQNTDRFNPSTIP